MISSRLSLSFCLLTTAALLSTANAQTPTPSPTVEPTYSTVLVFGDSLSDVGNLRHRFEDSYSIGYPGGDFNYSDGRFTNSTDTSPSSQNFVGVWHEQLSRDFLGLPASTNDLDGGDDFAFGGATTEDGSQDYTIVNGPFGQDATVRIDNMGAQVDAYVTRRTVDPAALFAVWGGGNDIFNDDTDANVTATASRMAMLVSKLADAGARLFLVPNVPPLGGVPRYSDDEATQATKNRASAAYRGQLDSNLNAVVAMFAAKGIHLDLKRLDIWSLFVRFVSDPAKYGFTDFLHSSQGNDVNPDVFLFWDDIHPTTAAHYQIATEANRVLTGAAATPGRALNVSTRATVGEGENASVGGFIVSGSVAKRVILRGIGPSLASHGISNALPNPVIELFDASGNSLALNDNWEDSQSAEIAATGLAPTNPLESAIVRNLPPGGYTVRLSGKDVPTGVGLVEVYDLGKGAKSMLANVSTRASVGTGDDVMIAGVIVGSGGDPIVVVRAIGPSLANGGIVNALQDPMLELYNINGDQIAANDNWRDGQPTATKATLLEPSDDREAVIVGSLPPDSYTAIVRGKDNTTGVALVEVYRIP